MHELPGPQKVLALKKAEKKVRQGSWSSGLVGVYKIERTESWYQRMPESLSALFRIVSFTAAKTSRMLDVSVACVKLSGKSVNSQQRRASEWHSLWIEVQMRPIHLVEPPEQVLGRLVDIVSAGVVWEVIAQR